MAVVRVSRIQILQRGLDKIIEEVVETDLLRRAENVLREIQITAPQSDGTRSYTDGVPGRTSGGRLANSFRIGFTTSHGKRVIRIFSSAKNSRGQFYAGLVIKGTKPHTIQATNQSDLAFRWISQGVFVITPQVQHPGTQPNNFVLEALRRAFPR